MGQVDNLAVAPSMYSKLSYDPVKDFAPIGIVGEAPLVIVARKDGPYRTLQALLEAARAKPGTVNYGSPGARSEEHTSELQSLMRISYAVFCLKKKNKQHGKQTY